MQINPRYSFVDRWQPWWGKLSEKFNFDAILNDSYEYKISWIITILLQLNGHE